MPKATEELWKKEAQRIGGESFVALILEMLESQKNSEAAEQATKTQLEKLNKAFPDSDVEGHRRYHEVQIEILLERRRLRKAVQEKTISGLFWACIVFVGTAMWHEIQYGIDYIMGRGE